MANKTRRVEIFRLLEDHTWDTIIAEIPACSNSEVEAVTQKFINDELIGQAQHRRAILMSLFSDNPDEGR